MTIRKGESWGEPGPLSADGVVARTDAEAAAVWEAVRRDGGPLPDVGLLGGDLHRTLGARRADEAALRAGEGVRFPIDLGLATLDEAREVLFCAHLVARGRTWFRGRTVAVMNAAFVGEWNVAPAAHPNDGRLNVVDGALPWSDRRAARARLPLGTHVPHPSLDERRVREATFTFEQPTLVLADGVELGRFRHVSIRTVPDAATVVA